MQIGFKYQDEYYLGWYPNVDINHNLSLIFVIHQLNIYNFIKNEIKEWSTNVVDLDRGFFTLITQKQYQTQILDSKKNSCIIDLNTLEFIYTIADVTKSGPIKDILMSLTGYPPDFEAYEIVLVDTCVNADRYDLLIEALKNSNLIIQPFINRHLNQIADFSVDKLHKLTPYVDQLAKLGCDFNIIIPYLYRVFLFPTLAVLIREYNDLSEGQPLDTYKDQTKLAYAAHRGYLYPVQQMLEDVTADDLNFVNQENKPRRFTPVSQINERKYSIFHQAVCGKNPRIILLMLKHGADPFRISFGHIREIDIMRYHKDMDICFNYIALGVEKQIRDEGLYAILPKDVQGLIREYFHEN